MEFRRGHFFDAWFCSSSMCGRIPMLWKVFHRNSWVFHMRPKCIVLFNRSFSWVDKLLNRISFHTYFVSMYGCYVKRGKTSMTKWIWNIIFHPPGIERDKTIHAICHIACTVVYCNSKIPFPIKCFKTFYTLNLLNFYHFHTRQIQLIVFSSDFIIKIEDYFFLLKCVYWYTSFLIPRFNCELYYRYKEADTDDFFYVIGYTICFLRRVL